jgi:diadenosine tetraphosphate (Ap4A) HIT family hydrolase
MSAGHTLVIPRRHVAGFFDMSDDERVAVMDLLATARRIVEARHHPDGYNIGVNVGRAAGQNRMHVHVHLIPRYSGDLPDPKGGVRRILEGKSR